MFKTKREARLNVLMYFICSKIEKLCSKGLKHSRYTINVCILATY